MLLPRGQVYKNMFDIIQKQELFIFSGGIESSKNFDRRRICRKEKKLLNKI